VLPGNIEYSAVSHPTASAGFAAAFQGGSVVSTLAVHRTVVRPDWINTLPGAAPVK
jgi:hypothetical protein